jgi:hypothetical protein
LRIIADRRTTDRGFLAVLSKISGDGMANYKRKRVRNGGCLRCKRHKLNGQKAGIRKTIAEKRADLKSADE